VEVPRYPHPATMDPHPQAPSVVAVVVASDPGEWLAETLAALGAQDYPNLSVLVLDAGNGPALPGVMGALAGLVEVDPGWEAAFEAAAGEAMAAVLVDDAEAGRRALSELARGGGVGTVLALGSLPRPPVPAPVIGTEPVRDHVHAARPEVEAALDLLLAAGDRLSRVVDRSEDQPVPAIRFPDEMRPLGPGPRDGA